MNPLLRVHQLEVSWSSVCCSLAYLQWVSVQDALEAFGASTYVQEQPLAAEEKQQIGATVSVAKLTEGRRARG